MDPCLPGVPVLGKVCSGCRSWCSRSWCSQRPPSWRLMSHSYVLQAYHCPTLTAACLTSALSTPRPYRKEPVHQDTPFLVSGHWGWADRRAESSGGRDNLSCPTPIQFREGRAKHSQPMAEAQGGLSAGGGHTECRSPRGSRFVAPRSRFRSWEGAESPALSYPPVVRRRPVSG